MTDISFSDIAIVSCGTMNLELNHLKKEGFLDAQKIYYTKPGLHQDYHELERQLIQGYPVSLDRFKSLLLEQADKLHSLTTT